MVATSLVMWKLEALCFILQFNHWLLLSIVLAVWEDPYQSNVCCLYQNLYPDTQTHITELNILQHLQWKWYESEWYKEQLIMDRKTGAWELLKKQLFSKILQPADTVWECVINCYSGYDIRHHWLHMLTSWDCSDATAFANLLDENMRTVLLTCHDPISYNCVSLGEFVNLEMFSALPRRDIKEIVKADNDKTKLEFDQHLRRLPCWLIK